MTNTQHVSELTKRYREAAEGTNNVDSQNANDCAKILRNIYMQLQGSVEGRNAIISLLSDSSPHVRCWAAAHSLFWAPDAARAVLEILRDNGGVCSFDAKWTLKEFDAGNLSFE